MENDDSPASPLRRFGGRLHHDTPDWVKPSSIFHLRIRVEYQQQVALTSPTLAHPLLESARFYHAQCRWWLDAFVLMPDHLHMLAAFPQPAEMSKVIGSWKRWHARINGVIWQDGYFDYRIRDEGCGPEYENKLDYIMNNPVRARLCERPEDWPWKI